MCDRDVLHGAIGKVIEYKPHPEPKWLGTFRDVLDRRYQHGLMQEQTGITGVAAVLWDVATGTLLVDVWTTTHSRHVRITSEEMLAQSSASEMLRHILARIEARSQRPFRKPGSRPWRKRGHGMGPVYA